MKLEEALKDIRKEFGTGAISGEVRMERWPSGNEDLDKALGGGWAKGGIIELFGWESSGKSTLTLTTCKSIQSQGKIVVYLDTEQAIDLDYAEQLGVDVSPNKFILSQPDNGEQTFEMIKRFIQVTEVGIIVVDSVASTQPKAIIDGEAGEAKIGLHARMMSQEVMKLRSRMKGSDCIVVFINQIREKIGVMWGNPEVTSGGKALQFYAMQRCKLSKSKEIKENDEAVGNIVKIKVVKNKAGRPGTEAILDLIYGQGFVVNEAEKLLEKCLDQGIIIKKGAWFYYGDLKFQGKANMLAIMEDNPEFVEELTEKLK